MRLSTLIGLTGLIGALVLEGGTFAAEPPFRLTEDGSAFLYRGRVGEGPSAVAARFGIGRHELGAFLDANGITDPRRVPLGHVYRIPNPVAVQAARAEARRAALAGKAARLRMRLTTVGRERDAARARERASAREASDLRWRARTWAPLLVTTGVLMVVAGTALAVAVGATRRMRRARRRLEALGAELDERRAASLADRQASARRILDLEHRAAALEVRLNAYRRPARGRETPSGSAA